MAIRTVYHVLPHAAGWQVKLAGARRASAVVPTKTAALRAARDLATNRPRSQVVIHHADGTIVADRTYEPAGYLVKRRRHRAAIKGARTRARRLVKRRRQHSTAAKKAATHRRRR